MQVADAGRARLRAAGARPASDALGVLVMELPDRRRHALWKQRLRDGEADAAHRARRSATCWRASTRYSAARPRARGAVRHRRDLLRHPARALPARHRRAPSGPRAGARARWSLQTQSHQRRAGARRRQPEEHPRRPARAPVLLDAECAWWGDPAFDLAFCLNHLLLKCLWTPPALSALHRLLRCAGARLPARASTGSRAEALERRAAALLPGLLLARVDGKSPVEYLTDEAQSRASCGACAPRAAAPAGDAAGRGGRRLAWEVEHDARMNGSTNDDPLRCTRAACGTAAAGRPSRPR